MTSKRRGKWSIKSGRSLPTSRRNQWGATLGVAYHEAGHAVVAHLLGKRVLSVWVKLTNSPLTHDGKRMLYGAVLYESDALHPILDHFSGRWPLSEKDRYLVELWNREPEADRQIHTERMADLMVMSAAGPIAQRRIHHRAMRLPLSGDQDDRSKVQRLALLLDGGSLMTAAERISAAEAQARQMIRANWGGIKAIAEALLERGELSAQEVETMTAGLTPC